MSLVASTPWKASQIPQPWAPSKCQIPTPWKNLFLLEMAAVSNCPTQGQCPSVKIPSQGKAGSVNFHMGAPPPPPWSLTLTGLLRLIYKFKNLRISSYLLAHGTYALCPPQATEGRGVCVRWCHHPRNFLGQSL